MLRESEGRRWVEEAAQTSICVTEGRDCPVSGWYMYLSTWLIHYCSVCNLWVAFPLHSELVQLFSIRVSLIPLYSPPTPSPCVQTNAHPIPHGLFHWHWLQTQQCTTEDPAIKRTEILFWECLLEKRSPRHWEPKKTTNLSVGTSLLRVNATKQHRSDSDLGKIPHFLWNSLLCTLKDRLFFLGSTLMES